VTGQNCSDPHCETGILCCSSDERSSPDQLAMQVLRVVGARGGDDVSTGQ
jgi:hypothetical protein